MASKNIFLKKLKSQSTILTKKKKKNQQKIPIKAGHAGRTTEHSLYSHSFSGIAYNICWKIHNKCVFFLIFPNCFVTPQKA